MHPKTGGGQRLQVLVSVLAALAVTLLIFTVITIKTLVALTALRARGGNASTQMTGAFQRMIAALLLVSSPNAIRAQESRDIRYERVAVLPPSEERDEKKWEPPPTRESQPVLIDELPLISPPDSNWIAVDERLTGEQSVWPPAPLVADKPGFALCADSRQHAWEVARTRRIAQALDAVEGKGLAPLAHRDRRNLQCRSDLLVVRALGCSQDNAAALGQRLGSRGGMDEFVERAAGLNVKLDGKRHSGHAQVPEVSNCYKGLSGRCTSSVCPSIVIATSAVFWQNTSENASARCW